ncbi:MAG: hypothetical protein ACFNMD_02535, partial [Prevotella sp.]
TAYWRGNHTPVVPLFLCQAEGAAAVNSAYGGRHTTSLTAVVRAYDGRRTSTISLALYAQTYTTLNSNR